MKQQKLSGLSAGHKPSPGKGSSFDANGSD